MADDDSGSDEITQQMGDQQAQTATQPPADDSSTGDSPPPPPSSSSDSNSDEGYAESASTTPAAAYSSTETMQHYMDQTTKARQSINKIQSMTMPMWEKYRQMLQQDQQMREDMPVDQKPPPIPTQQKNTFLGTISQLLAVAVPIAMMFGIRGNGYAKGAMMSGIGAFLQNYAKGRDAAAKEDMAAWTTQAKAIHESNQERHQLYRDILANKRLSLDDQFKMIHSVADEFMDPTMLKSSRTRSMKDVTRHLDNQEKVSRRFLNGANNAAKTLHPKYWTDYKEYIREESKKKLNREVDADTDRATADGIMPYVEWLSKYATATDRKRTASEEKAKEKKEKKDEDENPSSEKVRETLFPSD